MRALLVLVAACGTSASPPPAAPPVANHPPPVAPVRAPSLGVLAWPVPAFTPVQIAEVKACDTAKLAEKRYPKSLAINALATAFAAKTTCERATLAAACGERGDATFPAECIAAYAATLHANPAFAFSNGITGGYYGKQQIVDPPPIASHPLASVKLDYKWSGLGTAVAWTVSAHDLGSKPTFEVTGATPAIATWTPEIGKAIAAFRTSLPSFLPIKAPLAAVDCTDNYPEWTATLTFDDGNKLELSTNRSNLIGIGGPWQLTVGTATYIQLGPELTHSIIGLVKLLKLPIGEPGGEFCRGYDLQENAL